MLFHFRKIISAFFVLAPLLVIVLVRHDWRYGVIYYRYGWFYLSVFLLSIVTVTDFLCKNKNKTMEFRISALDIILTASIVLLVCNYYMTTSIAETYVCLDLLLYIFYACLRYWFQTDYSLAKIMKYGILAIGLIEAFWGTLQLYKSLPSYHANYSITGSFLNPGPYGGFLAVCLPIAVYLFLNEKKVITRYGLLFSLLLLMTMLPASMSRSAWIAAFAGTICVLISHYGWFSAWKKIKLSQKVIFIGIFITVILVTVCFLYHIKPVSVWGRVQVWGLSIQLLLKNFWQGIGIGNFSAAYGEEQIEGFKSGNTLLRLDENLADCPEYAFNEFLHAGVELGIIGLLFLVLIFVLSIKNNVQKRRWGTVGALASLLVFAQFSYPLRILSFWIVFISLLAEQSRTGYKIQNNNSIRSKLICILVFGFTLPLFHNRKEHFKALKIWNKAVYTDTFKEGYRYLRDQHLYLADYIDALMIEKRYFEANCVIHQLQSYYCDLKPFILEGMNWQSLGNKERAEETFLKAHYLVPNRFLPCYFLVQAYLANQKYAEAIKWAEYVLAKPVIFPSDIVSDIRKEMEQVINTHKPTEYETK